MWTELPLLIQNLRKNFDWSDKRTSVPEQEIEDNFIINFEGRILYLISPLLNAFGVTIHKV
jgi:hypothetical protein